MQIIDYLASFKYSLIKFDSVFTDLRMRVAEVVLKKSLFP